MPHPSRRAAARARIPPGAGASGGPGAADSPRAGEDGPMSALEAAKRENAALRERIATLSDAILRIGASLDLDTVLRAARRRRPRSRSAGNAAIVPPCATVSRTAARRAWLVFDSRKSKVVGCQWVIGHAKGLGTTYPCAVRFSTVVFRGLVQLSRSRHRSGARYWAIGPRRIVQSCRRRRRRCCAPQSFSHCR